MFRCFPSIDRFVQSLRKSVSARISILVSLVPGLVLWSPAYANPRGGSVVHGLAEIGSGAGGNLQIRQNSRNAIIEWDNFSIDAGEMTRFVQPGTNAAVLNRVVGGDPSQIHGALKANGNVFVINPSGILVGPSGTIDVHGLVLSTLDVSNGEFLAGGDMVFKGNSDAGVTNMGRINGIGGDVFLMGRTVQNSGSISATGTVGLGAGTEVLLTAGETTTGERMFVRSSGAGASGTGVLNDGSIEGAAVELKAHGNVYALAINNKGSVRATGTSTSGGKVFLRGVGGDVSNSGSIEVSGPGGANSGQILIEAAYAKVDGMLSAEGGSVRIAGSERTEIGATVDVSSPVGNGGDLVVEGPEIEIGATADIDASGESGGLVRIGGGFQGQDATVANALSLRVADGAEIRANAQGDGDAGSVVLWSDEETTFNGLIETEATGNGDGGFVEVSGKESLLFRGSVSTLSAGGENGTLLLDPTDFEVISGGAGAGGVNQISNIDLETQLSLGNVVIATDSAGGEDGTITIETGASVDWSTDNSLAFLAHGDVLFNASVQTTGAGDVTAIAGWNGTNGFGGAGGVNQPASIVFQDFIANPGWYGNASGGATGAVVVGDGTQTSGIVVGSLGGETNVAGQSVSLTGGATSTDYGQLGYRGAGTGAINVYAKNGGVTLASGDGGNSFVQIGHGGIAIAGEKSGNITVMSDNGVSVTGGLGSGGVAYAQIGHGGYHSDNDIGISAPSDIIVNAGAGAVSLTGGGSVGANAHYNYAKIGHGGDFVTFDVNGDVSVAGNGVSLTAGGFGDSTTGSRFASAQIGHGGRQAGPSSGDVTVDAGSGDLVVAGGAAGVDFNSAQIGHGGNYQVQGNIDGAIDVRANNIDVVGGGRSQNFARIGHGGWTSGANTGDRSGDIFLQAGGELSVDGDTGVAQVGHHTGTGSLIDANVTIEAASADETTADAAGNTFEVGNTFAATMAANLEGGDVSLHATGAGGSTFLPTVSMSFSEANDFNVLSENNVTVEGRVQNAGSGNINVIAGWDPTVGGAELADPVTGIIADVDMDSDIFGVSGSFGNNSGAVTISNATGAAAIGSLSGQTNVAADNVTLTGTGGGLAQIGFSGAGDGDGDIKVNAVSTVSLTGGSRYDRAQAQIGHGGYQLVGNKGGDITVEAGNGVTLTADQTGTGRFAYAQVGHGSRGNAATPNDYSGNIVVDGGSGSVDLIAGQDSGDQDFRNAQIGHGGSYDAQGNFSGNIEVRGSNVNLDAGARVFSYSRIGHGGWTGGVNSGTRTGSIYVETPGEVSIDPSGNAVAVIGHQNEDVAGTIFDADVTIQAASMDNVVGASGGTVFTVSDEIADMLAGDLAAGDVSLHATGAGGLLFNAGADVLFASSNDFNILSENAVQFQSSIQNSGNGNVNVVGGWSPGNAPLADPVTGIIAGVDFATDILGVADSFGNNDADIMLNATSGPVLVGSRGGETNVAADGVVVSGSDTNTDSGAQIGIETTGAENSTGAISVNALDGGIALNGGDAEGGYARIGHGGEDADGDAVAAINVESVGNIELASGAGVDSASQIGHGGTNSDGALSGSVTIESTAGQIILNSSSGGQRSYTQIGHGGYASKGDKGGDDGMGNLDTISVMAADDILLRSGGTDQQSYSQNDTYSMIGNGGYNADADSADSTGHRADIAVAAGTDGTGTVALEGSGSRNESDPSGSGVYNVDYGFDRAFTQIGNGGARSSGDHSGTISVSAADDVRINNGNDIENYSQIGHGGYDADALGTGHSGDISVTTADGNGGSVSVSGTPFGNSSYYNAGRSYVQIGHGGFGSRGDHNGNIIVDSDDTFEVRGGRADNTNAQVGHGGQNAQGDFSGSIAVTATNDIDIRGGTNNLTYAQVGHGGYNADGNHTAAFINVISENGSIDLVAGNPGSFQQQASDNLYKYAQIGLGGGLTTGNMSAPITVSADGNIYMEAGGNFYGYTQIGNGGWEAAGNKSGVVDVSSNSGKVTVSGAARHYDTYAQIGHGGVRVDGTLADDITVAAANGIDVLGGRREATGSFAQIGHGGLDSDGDKSGAIEVNTDSDANGSGDLTIAGGSAAQAYALVGHGGIGSDGYLDGRIDVSVGATLDMSGGSGAASGLEGNFNFAQIGHSLAGALGGYFLNDGSPDYAGRNGIVVGEGEYFTSTDDWVVLPEGTSLPQVPQPTGATETVFYEYSDARGGFYAQVPDSGVSLGPTTGSYLEYTFTVDQSGDYRFAPRWGSYNGASDSIFFDIKEIKDGTTGAPNTPGTNEVADWYEFSRQSNGVFSWDNSGGGYEENAAGDSNGDPLWNLTAGVEYTMRVTPRESGSAVDAWALQLDGMDAPSGMGPGATFANRSDVSGASDINVSVGGNISLNSGAESDAYAAIGHGGSSFTGVSANVQYGTDVDGADISVVSTGGNILLDGNSAASVGAERGYAAIGHHGIDAGFDAYGNVSVKSEAAGGTVSLTGGSGSDNFAQIGHGGGGDFLDGAATLSGEICVVADGGVSMSSPASGDRTFTQIGHGGNNLAGDFSGAVTVASENGAISLMGGSGSAGGQYSQIGHGGAGADGSLSGAIQVLAGGGDLTLTGGDADESYAMVGHGDGTGTSAGTREGGVEIFSSGAISATDGAGIGSDAVLFHQSGSGLAVADYLGGDGFQIVAADGTTVSDSSLGGLNTMIAGNIANGPVHVALSNDIDINLNGDLSGSAIAKNNSDNLIIATGGSIFVNQSYQQAGDGDVVLVAGYDGTGTVSGTPTFNSATCELEITGDSLVLDYNSCEDFGNNNSFIRVGDSNGDGNGDQVQGIAIGSSSGATEFAAYGLVVAGSDTTDRAFGQIGFRGDATGAIEGHLQAGGLTVQAGQGGFSSAYAQIGHGGSGSSAASLGGDISISFCEPGAVDILGGSGASSYAQVGLGGEGVDATITGTSAISTSILSGGAILVAGGTGTDAYAMVGAGGGGSDGTKTNAGVSVEGTSVEVRAGSGDNSFSQIGSGGGGNSSNDGAGGSVTGDVDVTATTGDVTISASGYRAYAQIGNGGVHRNNNVTRTLSGTIDVNAAEGSVVLNGGSGAGIGDSIALIGHGSFDGNTTIAAGSHISVDALNDVDLNGGSTTFAAAQIGHGGINSRNHTVNDSDIDINEKAGMGTGAVTLDGTSSNAYAQIGHGGARNDGSGDFSTFVGNVTVHQASNVTLTSGSSDAYTMIGHGGEGGLGNGSAGNYSGAIKVMTDGTVSLTAGAGADSFAQIGHGGEFSRADLSGDICVVAGTGVILDSDTNPGVDGYAMIGHGGDSTVGTTFSGDVNVTSLSGGVQMTARAPGSTSADQFVQIGHGGSNSSADMSGDLTVVAESGGDIALFGGDLIENYAMIGHGDAEGRSSTGAREGGVHILAEGTLTAASGTGGPNVNLYHQTGDAGGLGTNYLGGDGFDLIGLGGANIDPSAIDDISPMIGAGGAQSNILQGGVNIALNGDSDITFDGLDLSISTSNALNILTGGDITFLSNYQNDSDGDINLVAGWNGSGFSATVEYPGAPSDPDFCEPTIVADGMVDFTNCETFGFGDTGVVTIGNENQNDANLVGTREGSTSIGAHGLVIQASTATTGAGSQLGFFGTADDATGDTAIYLQEGGLAVIAGIDQSYAQVGHGGFGSASALREGAIDISFCEAGAVGLFAGTGASAYAQIGHGGENVDATLYRGDITIGAHSDGSGPGDVSIAGGDGDQAYAQIGHGGGNGTGSVEGSVEVRSSGAVNLVGGSFDDTYAQIGQGGFSHNASQIGVAGDRIVVIADGGILLNGGDTVGQPSGGPDIYGAYAQIGNGGYDADVNLTDGIVTDIFVNYDPDANGGMGALAGGGDVVLLGSTNTTTDPNYGTYAQIGHGGRNQEGAKIGDIIIGEAGDLRVEATLDRSYAQIGHGGNDGAAGNNNGNATGDVSILSSSSISVIGGEDRDAYAQIGHGGVQVGGDFSGDVTLISDGAISLDSGTNVGNYAMVGHGGYDADGTHQGNIYINYDIDSMSAVGGGDIILSGRAGGGFTFSQIGHGGRRFNGDITGDIVVGTADAISITGGGGSTNYSKIGHGGNDDDNTDDNGSASGSIRILESDSVTLEAGTASFTYAQIGHGGYQVAGDFGASSDVIDIRSTGDILLQGNGNDAYAQIGNGGTSSGGTFGATLTGDDLVGGTLVGGTQMGNVTVAAGGDIGILGGSSSRAYAMVGHGGYNTAANASGSIEVNADGNLRVEADGTDSFAQVGHGGGKPAAGDERFEAATISDSDITIDVVGNIEVNASTGSSNSYGQIGHGGFANLNTTVVDSDIRINEAMGSGTGTITVAGGFTNAPAMIGHGGSRQNSDRGRGSSAVSGDISIFQSGGISLNAGTGADGFAKIGHGGEGGNGALSGKVEVRSDGSIVLTGGTNNDTFAQIGHGRLEGDGDLDGMICVVAGDGLILDSETNSASDSYTMIGHGGDEAQGGTNGTFSGDINVVSLANGITLTANSGGTSGQFAQIGHGGEGSDADMSGDITVIADNGGDLTLTGGGHSDNYAMIGHGDGEGRDSTGTREGGVHLFAGGSLTATNGSTSGTVNIYHQTENAPLTFPGTYLGGDGYQVLANNVVSIDATALDDEGAMIAGNAAAGPVSLIRNNTDTIMFDGLDYDVDTESDFFIITGGSIEVLSSYQNSGGGDVVLIAGWDGTGVTFNTTVTYVGGDFCMPEIVDDVDFDFNGSCESFGLGGATVTIGDSGQTDAVQIGSRLGTTFVGAHGLVLEAGTGSNAASQIGFAGNGSGTIEGDVEIHLHEGGLQLNAGGANSYAQIGNGGIGAVRDAINDANISISFCEPDAGIVALNAGTGSSAYAQIGQGGYDYDADTDGSINILGSADVTLSANTGGNAYAMVGHGGNNGSATRSGVIDIQTADGSVTLQGSSGGGNSLAQIGHGGRSTSGTMTGNISVLANGTARDVNVFGGTGNEANAMIGHGGTAAGGNKGDDAGLIRVEASRDVLLRAGENNNSYAQIGSGGLASGGVKAGDIQVTAGRDVEVFAAQAGGDDAYAIIGNGGPQTGNTTRGSITVAAGNRVLLQAGDLAGGDTPNFAQIGHGGHNNGGSQGAAGDFIDVSGAQIDLIGGFNTAAYAQIGMGGYNAGGNLTGDVIVTATGAITLDATTAGGSDSYVQIGNGGSISGGAGTTFSGSIDVDAASLNLMAGDTPGQYAQIGHGGNGVETNIAAGSSIDVDVSGAIDISGGGDSTHAQIGHGGFNAIDMTVEDSAIRVNTAANMGTGAITLTGGSGQNATAQIGHGGARTDGNTGDRSAAGDITIDKSATITLQAGTNAGADNVDAYALIGNGGQDAQGDFSGNIEVNSSGDVQLLASSGSNRLYSQIGHGGASAPGNLSGNISVDVGGALTLDAGNSSEGFAQIGHGGSNGGTDGNTISSATITVDVTGATTLNGGNTDSAYAQIGHGGYQWNGNISGGIDFSAASLQLNAANAYAQVGHGGFGSDVGTISDSTIHVDVIDFLDLNGGNGTFDYAQIGHGGVQNGAAAGTNELVVTSSHILINTDAGSGGGDITLDANGSNAIAQIGHGGARSDSQPNYGSFAGDITVGASRNIILTGAGQTDAYTQIGHGGEGGTGNAGANDVNAGSVEGDISLTSSGTVSLTGGTGTDTYAQIGHGGDNSVYSTSAPSSILINAGSVSLSGNTGQDSYAQIGHGGSQSRGTNEGSITVLANTGAISLAGGTAGARTYSQIGHGGALSTGDSAGDVFLNINPLTFAPSTGTDVMLTGGPTAGSYAQVGHGGTGGSGNATGSVVGFANGVFNLSGGTELDTYALFGHGGADWDGTLGEAGDGVVAVGIGGVELMAGAGTSAFSQIGFGGSNVDGDRIADIFVNVDPRDGSPLGGGPVTLSANGENAFAQIGHGGIGSEGGALGDINLDTGGNLSLLASGAESAFTLVGHGGVDSPGFLDGDISVTVSGQVDVIGGGSSGDSFSGTNNFSQIGHALHATQSGFGGLVERDGRVVVEGEYFDTADDWIVVSYDGTEPVPEGFYALARGGRYVLVPEGAGGSSPATASNEITYTFTITEGGEYRLFPRWTGYDGGSDSFWTDIISVKDGPGGEADNYLFVGQGGSAFAWDSNAGFEDNAAGGVINNPADPVWNLTPGEYTLRFNPREDGVALDAFVLQNSSLGIPGTPAVTFASNAGANGSVDVRANGDIGLSGGINRGSHAAIGHGGSFIDTLPGRLSYGTDADRANVTVISETGGIVLEGGTATGDGGSTAGRYAAIGHHGTDSDFSAFGDVRVEARGTNVELIGGNGESSGARVGHGGDGAGFVANRSNADFAGSVDVVSAGGVNLTGGGTLGSDLEGGAVQVGHGGLDRLVDIVGGVTVDAEGAMQIQSGTGLNAFGQVGHGGINVDGTKLDGVSLTANELTITAGEGVFGFAQVGHGGVNSAGDTDGDVNVAVTNALEVSGNSGESSYAQVGHGGRQANGEKSGTVTVEGASITATAGSGNSSYVQFGHGGYLTNGDISGAALSFTSTTGDIILSGGAGSRSSVQVGHGGNDFSGSVANQAIDFASAGNFIMTGDGGLQSSVLVGHGGSGVVAGVLSGMISGTVDGELELTGGTGFSSFAQIGHGGRFTDGDIDGAIELDVVGDISMTAVAGADAAYSKIGHGDDIIGPFSAVAGTGSRSGNIRVATDGSLFMTDAMIGHVSSISPATATGGVTQIGVSREDPTDQNGGSLMADADSEFSGVDGLRFYMPRRGNNEISAGALLNGESYAGARTDPSPSQGDDEYTIRILGDEILFPNEHDNVFGSGPDPINAGGFAFYYDTIVLAEVVEPPVVVAPDSDSDDNAANELTNESLLDVSPLFGLELLFPDDRVSDDEQREKESLYTGYFPFYFYYEGYSQYGPNGESTFTFPGFDPE